MLADKLRDTARRRCWAPPTRAPTCRRWSPAPTFDRARAQALVDAKTAAVRARAREVIAAAGDFYDSLQARAAAEGARVHGQAPRLARPTRLTRPAARHGDNPPMRRILLIDDDELLAAPLAAYFGALRVRARQRPRGRAPGWPMLRATAYDAAILDVMLPEMDGFELCRTIRRDERQSRSSCSPRAAT